mgnify:CR=1 FL=1|tara:strand:+ start:445 stop:735 length:291 start_codon:yes stop_codon:yes gene_type:complete
MAISAVKEDAMLASIKSTFTVEGKTFDTKEEAEKHLENELKIKEASKKLKVIFKEKRGIHDYLTLYNSKDLAEFLFKNRHEIGEVLVDFGVVEHLF